MIFISCSCSDGVGAGQVQEVNDTEVSAIQKVLNSEAIKKEIPGGIKLTFIIVSKRINTRCLKCSCQLIIKCKIITKGAVCPSAIQHSLAIFVILT